MISQPRPVLASLALALTVALGSASCFDELPSPVTASESSSGSAATTGGETSSMDGMSSSSANQAMTEPDNDSDDSSSGGASEPALEGLFACSEDDGCDTWERPSCDGACPPLDAAGTCLFEHLKTRGGAVKLQYKDCGGACSLNVIVPRGAGDDTVDRQSAMINNDDAPVGFGEVQRCALVEQSFFEGCIADFTAECADPANWMGDCQVPEKPLCSS